jgi:hypothetical protein
MTTAMQYIHKKNAQAASRLRGCGKHYIYGKMLRDTRIPEANSRNHDRRIA